MMTGRLLADQGHAVVLHARSQARAEAARMVDGAELEKAERLRALELSLIAAQSSATVAERAAVQQGLIEALTGLGDKVVLGEVAKNMNLVSLFKGRDVATLLAEVVRGTKLDATLRTMTTRPPAPEGETPA